MSHISTAELARITGYTKRQIQRMAGKLPGAVRTDGGHWKIPDSPEVRRWCNLVICERRLRGDGWFQRREGPNALPAINRATRILADSVSGMTWAECRELAADSAVLFDLLVEVRARGGY